MATRLPKVNSGTVSHDRQVSIFDIYLKKLWLLWVYCPGHAGVEGNDREDTLVGKVNEVLRSSRHFLQAQSQDITPSIAWRREARKEEALHGLPCKTKKRHLQSNKKRNYLRLYHLLSLSQSKTKQNTTTKQRSKCWLATSLKKRRSKAQKEKEGKAEGKQEDDEGGT